MIFIYDSASPESLSGKTGLHGIHVSGYRIEEGWYNFILFLLCMIKFKSLIRSSVMTTAQSIAEINVPAVLFRVLGKGYWCCHLCREGGGPKSQIPNTIFSMSFRQIGRTLWPYGPLICLLPYQKYLTILGGLSDECCLSWLKNCIFFFALCWAISQKTKSWLMLPLR